MEKRSTKKEYTKTEHSWISKLFTKEDPLNLHKTLGFLSVSSFLYRYIYVMFFTDIKYLGFELKDKTFIFNLLTIALHFALSYSSVIFHVLKQRIISKPMVIWEEYRLHAIAFTGRACLIALYGLFRPFKGSLWENACMFGIYLTMNLIVDEITRRHGSPGKYTTVRVDGDVRPQTKVILRMYSFYQFCAIATHITPSDSVADMGFNALIAIQSSAFLMTLYRKGLIDWYTHGIIYSICLIISMLQMLTVFPDVFFWLKVISVFIMRTNFRVSKYVCWSIFALLTVYPGSFDSGLNITLSYPGIATIFSN